MQVEVGVLQVNLFHNMHYKMLWIGLVVKVVLTARLFSRVAGVTIRTPFTTMHLMHSTIIIKRIRFLVAVILVALRLQRAPIQVSQLTLLFFRNL